METWSKIHNEKIHVQIKYSLSKLLQLSIHQCNAHFVAETMLKCVRAIATCKCARYSVAIIVFMDIVTCANCHRSCFIIQQCFTGWIADSIAVLKFNQTFICSLCHLELNVFSRSFSSVNNKPSCHVLLNSWFLQQGMRFRANKWTPSSLLCKHFYCLTRMRLLQNTHKPKLSLMWRSP